MALIEGIDDALASEYERLRGELRLAISESEYTMGQVAALAGIGERTLRSVLAGSHAAQIDTLMRVAFVVGCRIEVTLPEGASSRPFQVVPSDQPSLGSVRSSQVSGGRLRASNESTTSDSNTVEKRTVAKKVPQQQRKRAPRKGVTGWSLRSVPDLREHTAVRAIWPRMTAPGSKTA